MKLIEAYIYEVTRRLPEKLRNDIALELRSTIEDMLPDHYSEEEEMEVLSKLGDPARLAASYRDTPMHLIGPKVYDAYFWTLKMIIPWAILITVLVHVVETIVLFSGEESVLSVVIKSFGIIIANIIHVLIQTFFWVTIVFVFIERIGMAKSDGSLTKYGTEWTPEQLKTVLVISKKKVIPRGEVIFSLVWTAIWVVLYFNADHLAGVYRSMDGEGLQMVMRALNQDVLMSYLPIVLPFALLEIGLALFKWKERQWTMRLVTVNAVLKVFSVVVLTIIATNPTLLNEAMIPYLATELNINMSSVNNFIDWAVWTVITVIIVTAVIEIYDSYRKAKA
ncbi:HAAS signaling domain-containing protein [Sporosarcina sp. SAFN-015]|uniref:HAAS signaling domain-containing protein n=1 Tax=Sporosarcina sp. SAFN-015 TaxID=3387274 RepID=UPI003F7D79DB